MKKNRADKACGYESLPIKRAEAISFIFILMALFYSSHVFAAKVIAVDVADADYYGKMVTDLIAKENSEAERACERIKNDREWKFFSDNYKKLYALSEDDRQKIRSSASPDLFMDLYHAKSIRAYSGVLDGGYSKNLMEDLRLTRIARVLTICGEELFKKGLIFPDFMKPADERQFMKIVDKARAAIKMLDDSILKYKDPIIEKSTLDDIRSDIFGYIQNKFSVYKVDEFTEGFIFPFHDVIEGGHDIYSRELDQKRLEIGVNNIFAFLKKVRSDEINRTLAEENRKKEKAKEENEREDRIREVKNGNIKAARSCYEVADGMTDKKVNKNFFDILVRPDNQLRLGVAIIRGSEKGSIIGYIRNILSVERFFVLRHNNKTVWFDENLRHGDEIVFFGKYVDNTSVRFGDGIERPAAVYDLVCISKYNQ